MMKGDDLDFQHFFCYTDTKPKKFPDVLSETEHAHLYLQILSSKRWGRVFSDDTITWDLFAYIRGASSCDL